MKKNISLYIILLLSIFSSCKYDDDALWNEINGLKDRIEALEKELTNINSSISNLNSIIEKLEKKVFVNSIDSTENGYSILFSDGNTIHITNGKDGVDAPIIGVKLFEGKYYWTQTFIGKTQWLLDENGEKLPVTGKDAISPLLKVDMLGYWMVSYDGGISYTNIRNEKGELIKAVGKDGIDGQDGNDGDSFFTNIEVIGNALVITLQNGSIINLPIEPSSSITISGIAEKGPFISGSTITLYSLNNEFLQNGETVQNTIDNNQSKFKLQNIKSSAKYGLLEVNGHFYNETTQSISNISYAINSIVDLQETGTNNINILTHLISKRIIHLIKAENKNFEDAIKTAQNELLSQFGLQRYLTKDANKISISEGGDNAGILIALSTMILYYGSDEYDSHSLLTDLTNEFSLQGHFSVSTKDKLTKNLYYISQSINSIKSSLEEKYKELGLELTISNLDKYFDWDKDGIAGNEVSDNPYVELDIDKIEASAEGGEFTINIDSNIPVYLEVPLFNSEEQENPDSYTPNQSIIDNLYEVDSSQKIDYSISKIDNTIKITIKPSLFKHDKTTTIPLYEARGNIVAEIQLTQKGNPKQSIPKLGSEGISYWKGVVEDMKSIFTLQNKIENEYVGKNIILNDNNHGIATLWASYYKSLKQTLILKDIDKERLCCFQEPIHTHLALLYYSMSQYWGGVPFFLRQLSWDEASNIPKTPMKDIYIILKEKLRDLIPYLEEKHYNCFSDTNDAFFYSKDIARILLAYMHIELKEYNEALPYLEKVINNNFYEVESIQKGTKKECILGYYTLDNSSIISILDFKDVILMASESYYYTNNKEKAREYVNLLATKKCIKVEGIDLLKDISILRKGLKNSFFIPFVRRNKLGESIFSFPEFRPFQLLWPIPIKEISFNSNLTQNPGY